MATSTKTALASALKEIMKEKPMKKITVKDIVEKCGVNRQTFYYHFNDVYDLLEWVFEDDANKYLPKEIIYENWREDVLKFFEYLYENRSFALNVYNSQSRLYMLKYLKAKLQNCICGFAKIVAEGVNIDRADFDFIVEIYSHTIVGLISQWMDLEMELPPEITKERFIRALDGTVESMVEKFKSK